MKIGAGLKIVRAYGTSHSAPRGKNEHNSGDAHRSANVSE